MAVNQSSFSHFLNSSPASARPRVQPGSLVNPLTSLRPPARKLGGGWGSLFTIPREPEDARLTGGTRSLDRRLLALNFPRSATAAGSVAGKNAPASERSQLRSAVA